MALNTIKIDDNLKAIVGIPGWANDLANKQYAQSAGDPVEAWASVPLLYRAVNLRASSISSVPYIVFRKDEEVEYPLQPDLSSVIFQMELGLLLTGAAYALKHYNGPVLTGVHVLNPTTVKWDMKDGESYFTQTIGGKKYGPWGPENMVAIREPSMTADVGPGVPPASVALSASQLSFNMQEFANKFFEQGGMPATLISTSANPNPQELERAQSFFRRRLSGVTNAWRTLFLRGDIKVTTLTPDLKSMSMKELSDHVTLDIAASLGVPRSVLESDASNYATSQTDMYSFWNMTVRPRLPLFEDAINSQLLGGTDYSIKFVPETMEIFQEDESLRAGSLLQLVQAGVPLADAMLMLGYNPLENAPLPPEDEGIEEDLEGIDSEEVLVDSEIASWQRFAIRSLGKTNKRKFEVKHIPIEQAKEIQALLDKAESVEEVRVAFGSRMFPLDWQQYP